MLCQFRLRSLLSQEVLLCFLYLTQSSWSCWPGSFPTAQLDLPQGAASLSRDKGYNLIPLKATQTTILLSAVVGVKVQHLLEDVIAALGVLG